MSTCCDEDRIVINLSPLEAPSPQPGEDCVHVGFFSVRLSETEMRFASVVLIRRQPLCEELVEEMRRTICAADPSTATLMSSATFAVPQA